MEASETGGNDWRDKGQRVATLFKITKASILAAASTGMTA
jgi:hypothetical protein